MATKNSKRIVIDASILRGAGTADHPRSLHCRRVLDTVIAICHRAVITQDIQIEWKDHILGKGTSRLWYTQMERRKDKLHIVKVSRNQTLRNNVDMLETEEPVKAILRKDVHLIEAAMLTDKIILSVDDRARKHFALLIDQLPECAEVMWANPEFDETVIEWLKEGAEPDKRRCLGYTNDSP